MAPIQTEYSLSEYFFLNIVKISRSPDIHNKKGQTFVRELLK